MYENSAMQTYCYAGRRNVEAKTTMLSVTSRNVLEQNISLDLNLNLFYLLEPDPHLQVKLRGVLR